MSTGGILPLKNAVAQSDIDMAHHSLLNFDVTGLLPSVVNAGLDKDIYIAKRTDSAVGHGTAIDPFDGSTQALLDAKLLALYNGGVNGLRIHLGAGIFTTRGTVNGWLARQHWKIIGAGRDVTILQFDATYSPSAAQQIGLIQSSSAVDGDGIEISDITLDCNSQNVTGATANSDKNFKIFGCYLYGSNNVYRNVRVRNAFGSFVNNLECFDLGIEGIAAVAAKNNKAINCIAETPRGNYHCGILCAANPAGGATPIGYANSAISCFVSGYSAATGVSVGISANTIIDCVADTCARGFRWEPADDLKIIGNKVLNNSFACIDIEDTTGANNVLIQGNTLEMRDDGHEWGIFSGGGGTDKNFIIDANTFLIKAGAGGATISPFNLELATGQGYSITNNKFATSGLTYTGLPTDFYSNGNRTLAGAKISALPDAQITDLYDDNGKLVIQHSSTTNAVNYWQAINSATGSNPILAAVGTDTDIAASISPKGAGQIFLNGSAGLRVVGPIQLVTNSDASVANGRLYFSTDQNYLAYKDSGGTVRILKTTVAGGTIDSTSNPLKGDGSGNAVAATTSGTGAVALVNTPTLITPILGVATATSVNKVVFTAPSTAATVTFDGDSKSYAMPDITTKIGFRHIPQNSQSVAYTTVLTDSGKNIYHPASDNNTRIFTIDSNANVAYPLGTILVFTNMAAANLTVAITSDTMTLIGTGTTGSRTVAQYGRLVAEKIETTQWLATPVANVT